MSLHRRPKISALTPVIDLRTTEASYNPYEASKVLVGDREAIARPYRFDTEPQTSALLNDAGREIKPTHLASGCPFCGHGIDIVVADVHKDAGIFCGNCNAGPVRLTGVLDTKPPTATTVSTKTMMVDEATAAAAIDLADPFCNPIAAGLVSQDDLAGTSPTPTTTEASDIFAAPPVGERILEGQPTQPKAVDAPKKISPTKPKRGPKPKREPKSKLKPQASPLSKTLDSALDFGPEPEIPDSLPDLP